MTAIDHVYGESGEVFDRTSLVITGLLAASGMALAGTLALTKATQAAGVSPAVHGFWMSLGAGALLGLIALARGDTTVRRSVARYALVAGAVTLAIPQLILFIVAGKIGTGLTSVVYALPTLATWAMARVLGMEPPSAVRSTGLIVAATGAVVLLFPTSGSIPRDAVPWLAFTLVAPVILGAGNIYRKVAWPEGASPLILAAGTALSASLTFLAAAMLTDGSLAFWHMLDASILITVQIAVATAQFLVFFTLQRLAGPVVFSLIGQIALVFGLIIGIVLFGERYSAAAMGAAGLIMLGWALVSFGASKLIAPARSDANN